MKLLPCPFCGGSAGIGSGKDYHFVNCTQCLASTNLLIAEDLKVEEQEAAEAWNKRTQLIALKTAINHLEYMAAWIGKQNAGYSFESLGEDMPNIRAALEM